MRQNNDIKAALVALGVTFFLVLTSACGGGSTEAEPSGSKPSHSAATSAGGSLPAACDLVTAADATEVLGTAAKHPGGTAAQRATVSTDVLCVWARAGTPLVFDDVPAVTVSILRAKPEIVRALRSAPTSAGLQPTDELPRDAWLSIEEDEDQGGVQIAYDDDTVLQFSVVRQASSARADADLALELAKKAFARL